MLTLGAANPLDVTGRGCCADHGTGSIRGALAQWLWGACGELAGGAAEYRQPRVEQFGIPELKIHFASAGTVVNVCVAGIRMPRTPMFAPEGTVKSSVPRWPAV